VLGAAGKGAEAALMVPLLGLGAKTAAGYGYFAQW
jgi:CRISPR/Cas system CMR subunit Cmr6 (Cas7 group RAMP superfamily)